LRIGEQVVVVATPSVAVEDVAAAQRAQARDGRQCVEQRPPVLQNDTRSTVRRVQQQPATTSSHNLQDSSTQLLH
jgi:hypothetical protein